jgi:hypothetical protein
LSGRVLTTNCICCRWVATEGCNCPQALINRADIKVDLNFVILYESLIPPLSWYLSAVLFWSNYIRLLQGTRLYLKLSLKLIRLLKPITI